MKRMILLVFCACVLAPMAQAATNINVAAGSSIQTAIDSAAEGDTITLTSSALYKGNLRINKSINLVAAPGVSPIVEQLDNTTTCPVILGVSASPADIRIGSLTGGRLTFQYLKWGFGTAATMPTGMIRIESTTGSTVLIENCDLISTGTTTFGPCTGIQHGQNPVAVTVRYSNIDLKRADYAAGGVSGNRVGCTGIDISNNSPTGGATITRRIPGPAYTLDHVRIKGYVRAGLWLHYTSMTLTASYIDVGTAGENTLIGTANIPWGPITSFAAASTWTGRIDHSIFQGPLNYAAFGKIGPRGTSITLSRSVVLGTGGANASYGGLDVASQNGGTTGWATTTTLAVDHCDLVHLGNGPSSALVRAVANGNLDMTITNSNIYSLKAQAINLVQIASPNRFTSRNNNVFGVTANVGYTAGTGDLSMDPLYFDVLNLDLRYNNNTLKTADSTGKPIGVNADYADVFNIIAGEEGVINRAHGWTTLK